MADVSGSEILGNQGNANLGYGQGVGYAGNPAVTNPLQSIDDNMRLLHQEDFQNNMLQYHQKIKDRDKVYELLAQGVDLSGYNPGAGLKGPNGQNISYGFLDPDKEVLQKEADEIRDLVVANPRIQTDRAKFTELEGKLAKHEESKKTAQARAQQASQQRLDIANENDADERMLRQRHLASELALPGKVPDPYLKPLSFDSALVTPDVKAEASGKPQYYQDEKGIWHQKDNVATSIDNFDNTAKYIPGNPYFTHANNLYKRAISSENFLNPDFVNKTNDRILEINEKEGLRPGDSKYVNPIASIDENTGKVIPARNAADFVRSLHLAQKYKNDEVDTVSKDAQNAAKLFAQQKKEESATQLQDAKRKQEVPAHAAQMKAMADKYEAEARWNDRRGEKLAAESDRLKNDAIAPVKQSFDAFNNYSNKLTFQPAEEATKGMNPAQATRFKEIIGNTAGMNIGIIPSNDEAAVKILSNPKIDAGAPGAFNTTKASGKVLGIVKPKYMYMAKSDNGDPNDTKLIGVFADGSSVAVNRKDAVSRIIDYNSKFSSGEKIAKMKNASNLVVEDFNSGMGAKPAAKQSATKPGKREFINPNTVKDGDVRQNGGVTEVKIGGVWRKAIGRDSQSGSIIIE